MILKINERLTDAGNFGEAFSSTPEFIIIHGSGLSPGATGEAELAYLKRPGVGVSYHFYIQKSGEVTRLVPETHVAWHAGTSEWNAAIATERGFDFPGEDMGRSWAKLNHCSLGIGLTSHNQDDELYPGTQLEAVVALCGAYMGRFGIPYWRVLTHAMISAPRKTDPLAFPYLDFLEALTT